MPAADHPVWPIVRLLVLFFGLMGILYVNATKFDANELRILIGFVIFSGVAEVGAKWASSRKERPEPPQFE